MDTSSTITTKSGAQKIGKSTAGVMQQPKDATVNDRDRLNGILMHEKQLMQGYTTGLAEAFDPDLYNRIKENRSRIEELHSRTVEALFNTGNIPPISLETQVTDAYDVFKDTSTSSLPAINGHRGRFLCRKENKNCPLEASHRVE